MPPIAWPLLLAWGCHVSPTHHPCPLINSQVEGYAFAMSAATLATTRFRISWATVCALFVQVCLVIALVHCSGARCVCSIVHIEWACHACGRWKDGKVFIKTLNHPFLAFMDMDSSLNICT
eukprot:1160735-Pelagomonas_calceolata.AAC.9